MTNIQSAAQPSESDLLNVKDPHPTGRALAARAQALIPGGAHTYAKGNDQYPWFAPPMIVRGAGCRVWDADGAEYIEYGMGLRAITLGHAEPRVNAAASWAMEDGINFLRPSPLEFELAEELVREIPCAEMVKFAKNGSDVTTAAVKLARACTGRDLVAICADHPFFSVDDWFIGATEFDAGIPDAVRSQTLKFPYGNISAVEALFASHPKAIACVMLEVETTTPPPPGYLESLLALCEREGALLIFDEIITGYRWSLGGAQSIYGVTPHLATFGKAMANGFPLAALVGRKQFMERGGLDHPHPRVFLLSTTAGAERISLAAALETLAIYREQNVVAALHETGRQLRTGLEQIIASHGLSDYFGLLGRDCNLIFVTKDAEGARSQAFRTLFMQEMVKRGVLAPSLVVSFAHLPDDVNKTLEAAEGALAVYKQAIEQGCEQFLVGPSVKPVMRRFN